MRNLPLLFHSLNQLGLSIILKTPLQIRQNILSRPARGANNEDAPKPLLVTPISLLKCRAGLGDGVNNPTLFTERPLSRLVGGLLSFFFPYLWMTPEGFIPVRLRERSPNSVGALKQNRLD